MPRSFIVAVVLLLAGSAAAAPRPAKLVAEPASLTIGAVAPGEKKALKFELKNVGQAAAKNVRCKGAGFTFGPPVSVEGGASAAIEATYTAPKAVKKATAIKATIVCGAAKLTAKGSITPPDAAAPKAGAKAIPPVTVTLAACKSKQPPVTLNHKKHGTTLKIACDTCHHVHKGLKAGAAIVVKRCSECHLEPEGKAGSCKTMSLTTNPFHVRCLGCHKAKGGAAPTKCADCHKK